MKISLIIMAIIVAVGHSEHYANILAQRPNPQDVLNRHIGQITFDSDEPINAFTAALRAARLPGGVINSETSPQSKKTVIAGPSLEDVLRGITNVAPGYRWSLESDVVNLIPVAGEPSLLSFRIKQFDIDRATSLQTALNKLLTQSEVRKRIDELGLNTGLQVKVGAVSVQSQQSKTIANVHCSNATIREVLNAFVSAHGTAIWEYRETHWRGHNGFSVEFLMQ
jgi:hypothetical protein